MGLCIMKSYLCAFLGFCSSVRRSGMFTKAVKLLKSHRESVFQSCIIKEYFSVFLSVFKASIKRGNLLGELFN